MRKSRFALLVTTIAVLFLYASCSVPLDPAWKMTSETTLSLKFGVLGETGPSASRAIVQGTGYLYIRTLGGPSGSSGPFYGPFTVAPGATFTTKDIPAGSYSEFGILYSAEPLESKSFISGGKTYTFTEAMKLPDADFDALMSSTDGGSAFAGMLGGRASATTVTGVKIEDGKANTIKATLVPIVDSTGWIDLSSVQNKDVTGDGTTSIKRFFALSGVEYGVPTGKSIDQLAVTITATAASEIGAIALYDQNGALLHSSPAIGLLGAGATKTITIPYVLSPEYFVYIEYKSTNFRLEFNRTFKDIPVTPSSGLSVKLSGATDYIGKNFIFALTSIDPATGMSGSSSSAGLDGLIGWAMGQIASDGSVTLVAKDESLTAPVDPSKFAGSAYLIAFIDTNNSITDLMTAEFETSDLYYFSPTSFTLTGLAQLIPVDRTAFIPYPGDPSGTTGSVKVSVTGISTYANHKFLYGITNTDGAPDASGSNLVGFGIMTLDASGSGISEPVDISTKAPLVLTDGLIYYLSGFVDMNDNYAALTDLSLADFSGIQPHYGDYSIDSSLSFTAMSGLTLNLAPAQFTLTNHYVFYAAQVASGTGTGATPANACTLETAILNANTLGSSTINVMIDLVGTVTPTSAITATAPVVITTSSLSGKLKLVNSGILASAGSDVKLANLAVDASVYAGTLSPLQVETGGKLLLYQSVFTGNNTNSAVIDGGAAVVSGGTFGLYDSTITSASATGNGGAVFVSNPSSSSSVPAAFVMTNNSKLVNCHADIAGGAVYVSAYSGVSLSGTETFSGNTQGAAVANDIYTVADTSIVSDPSLLISGGKVLHDGAGTIDTAGISPSIRYVSASGTGDGLTESNPCSLGSAMADPAVMTIMLLTDVTVSSSYSISRTIGINGLSSIVHIYADSGLTGSVFTVGSGGALGLVNVIVGPAVKPATPSGSSVLSVSSGGSLMLSTGTIVQNANIAGFGGGVYVDGGMLGFIGGTVNNCSAKSGGGGVYVKGSDSSTPGSILFSSGGSVSGCSSDGSGGGIYVGSYGGLVITQGSITLNSSGMTGGGAYIGSGGMMSLGDATFTITGNSATLDGGAAYIDLGGVLSDPSGYATSGTCVYGNYVGSNPSGVVNAN